MHILFFVFVAVPLILIAWKIFVELPIDMLMDGNTAGAFFWVAVVWGIPLLIFFGISHG